MKPPTAADGADHSEEILALVRSLHDTQQRLRELTGGQVDAVLHQGGQSYLLHEAQEKLRTSEASQRVFAATQESILNALPADVALLDPEGVIIAANEGWRRFSGADGLQGSGARLGDNYLEICERAQGDGAEEAHRAAAGIREVFSGAAKAFSLEYPCHLPTEKRWFQLMVTPLNNDPPRRAAVMHINITARKLIEEQLLSKTAMFEAQVHSSLDGILIVNSEDKKILQNQRMTDLWEIPPEIAANPDDRVQFDWVRGRVKNPIEFAQKTAHLKLHPEELFRDEIDLLNGKVFDRYSAPVRGVDGKHYGRIWIFRDITAQKRNEMRLGRLVQSNAQGVFIWNANGGITEANDAFLNLTGYSREDMLSGRINWVQMTPSEFTNLDRHASEEIAARGTCEPYEKEFIRKDGSRIPVLIGAANFEDNAEEGICFVLDLTERKRSESRFRRLVDSNAQGVMFWKANRDITDANEAFLRLVGYTREDLESGRLNCRDLTPPEYRESDDLAMEEIGAQGYCEPREKEWIRKDGSRVPVYVSAACFEDTPDQGVTFAVDLTDRKRAEQAQRLSEERFSHAFEYAPHGMVIAAPDGEVITANRTMCELTGYSLQEVMRKRFEEMTHPEDLAKELELIHQMLRGEIHHYEIEKRGFHKDGHEICVHLSSSLVRDSNDQPLYFIKQIQDVTEIKRAYQQIEEQAALIDEASDAIFSRDLEHRIIFWGKSAERLFGWTADEARGQSAKDILKVDDAKFTEADKSLRETGRWNGEMQKVTKAGTVLIINSRWTLLRDANGQPRSILTIDSDVTERRRLEQQFLRAQRMESIGTLAGGIAHDLNNILAPIMMSIDVLKSISDNPEAGEILETIRVSAKRGADIVRQVLSFARGVEGRRIEVQPKHILEDVENIVKNTFPKSIQVRTSIPTDTWTILGDPTQIHQILLNLCVNARDAMPNGGSLTVTVENFILDHQYSVMSHQAKPGPYVQISVTDTGTGIPPELLERIFEPFFTTKEVSKGTGLGLSTVMAIVKSHEGTINVYSEVGKGTTFKVYLPAMEVAPEKKSIETQRVSLPRGNGETILVVDDEASILTITSQTLLAFGYRVLKAADGAEAVALYAEHKNEIAVVLTDMMMPVLDGSALIHALKRMNPAIKIIAASGLNADSNVSKVTDAGVKHFLTKPYTAGTLLKTLEEIVNEG